MIQGPGFFIGPCGPLNNSFDAEWGTSRSIQGPPPWQVDKRTAKHRPRFLLRYRTASWRHLHPYRRSLSEKYPYGCICSKRPRNAGILGHFFIPNISVSTMTHWYLANFGSRAGIALWLTWLRAEKPPYSALISGFEHILGIIVEKIDFHGHFSIISPELCFFSWIWAEFRMKYALPIRP